MNKNNNIIIINHKRYDATTGDLLSSHKSHSSSPASHSETPVPRAHRKVAKHAAAHPPKRSQTLMRRAVKKPSPSLKLRIKAQGRIDKSTDRIAPADVPATYLKHLDARLLGYAQKIKESGRISHFSSTASDVISQTPERIAVVHTPVARRQAARVRKPKTTAELLDYALQHATSHEQKLPKQHRRNPFKRSLGV